MTRVHSILAASVAVVMIAACGGSPGSSASPSASPPAPTPSGTPASTPDSGTPSPTGLPEPTPTGTPGAVVLPDVARIAAGETPAGWQEVQSTDGACRMAVPADWDTETMPNAAIAPAFVGQVMLSSDPLENWGSWEAYGDAVQAAYFGADKVVLLETDELFVMAAGPSSPGASVLVGRNRGESVCGILLTLTGNGAAQLLDTGYQVLYSLDAID